MPINTNYTLHQFDLYSGKGGSDNPDVRPYIVEINFFESVYSEFMTGYVIVSEAISMVETYAITGEERISVVFSIMGGAGNTTPVNRIAKDFVLTRIEDHKIVNHKTVSYKLSFASEVLDTNMNKRSRKMFFGLQSDIVAQLVSEQLGSSLARNDATAVEKKYIFPNWHPITCINELRKQSFSEKYGDPHYNFYEDFEGFHFVSDSFMVDSPEVVSASGIFKERIVGDQFAAQYAYNLEKTHYKHTFYTLNNLQYGAYGNTLNYNDIRNKYWRENERSYEEAFGIFKHCEDAQLVFERGDGRGNKNKYQLIPAHMPENDGVYEHEEMTDFRLNLPIRQMDFNHNMLVLEFAADPAVKIGRPMFLDIRSVREHNTEPLHETLHGYFLITHIRHLFRVGSVYQQFVEIAKDSYWN